MTDKELFDWKKTEGALIEWDRGAASKSDVFVEARNRHDYETCFHELCQKMVILKDERRFVYFFDFDFRFDTSIFNITPDYQKILTGGLKSLQYTVQECTTDFCWKYNTVLADMELLAGRIAETYIDQPDKHRWFSNIADRAADNFEEAIQRILFLNQLIWQTGSHLVGLGRLDMLLFPFYEKDCADGKLTREKAGDILKDLMYMLHEHYWYKSSELLGDTGQVMVLGGTDRDGNYVRNELTDLLIETVTECRLSDPKIVLRTSSGMPRDLMELSVRCMQTGIGSPLLSNDDVIVPRLIGFGVDKEDAYDYITSACWEPLAGGKSSSMNNQSSLIYIKSLEYLLTEEKTGEILSFDMLMERLMRYIRRLVLRCEKNLYEQTFFGNTLYSIFIEGCRESKKDIVDGGAKYHNVGMTTVGLGNLVNSLLNIKKYVFEEKRYSLSEIKKMCVSNYEGNDEARRLFSGEEIRYGKDDPEIIGITNDIIRFVTKLTQRFRTPTGGRLKFGLSSPSYVNAGKNTRASADGRKKGDPLVVHISNERLDSYTELINFASQIDYDQNRFNGNVVDFMVNPSFMESNFDKFVSLLLRGTEAGYFQLQTNVISSEILKEAKKHPQKFPNLIVRVWGFSAYFIELPESYQDLLIMRSEKNERYVA